VSNLSIKINDFRCPKIECTSSHLHCNCNCPRPRLCHPSCCYCYLGLPILFYGIFIYRCL